MAKTKTTDMPIDSQDFQIPQEDELTHNFNQTVNSDEIPVNQLANQGVPAKDAISPPNNSVSIKPNQSDVFGKSELLNSNQILAQMLNVKIGQRVADLGAGGGMFTIQSARLVGEPGQVYAVDIIKNTLSDIESKARMANLYNIKTVWSNLEMVGATKIPEASLDHALLVNVLFQSSNVENMIKEAIRLLKSGGKLLVIDWSDTSSGLGPNKERHINPDSIMQIAQKNNLIIEQRFKAGQYHFGLIFIKP